MKYYFHVILRLNSSLHPNLFLQGYLPSMCAIIWLDKGYRLLKLSSSMQSILRGTVNELEYLYVIELLFLKMLANSKAYLILTEIDFVSVDLCIYIDLEKLCPSHALLLLIHRTWESCNCFHNLFFPGRTLGSFAELAIKSENEIEKIQHNKQNLVIHRINVSSDNILYFLLV